MIEIKRITSEEQELLLLKKIETRMEIAALTDDSNPNAETNRTLVLDLCQADWKFFVNNFVWIQNPKADEANEKEIPFFLWDYQEKAGDEVVKAVESGYDLPIEKSRDMGITWLILTILDWGWNFHQWEVLVGSRKFEEVDNKGDIGTLFEKLRYIHSRLPEWMMPKLIERKHDSTGKLLHPVHSSSIVGEGNNPHFGRSDRRKVVFLDEFTSWEYTDKPAYHGLSATTKCRIPVSTPNVRGTNCYFYQIIEDCKKHGKPYLQLLWTLRPDFSKGLYYDELGNPKSPWYDSEIARASDPESVAQEIDINYEAAATGKVFPSFSVEKQVLDTIEYNEDWPLYVAWDFGLDTTAMLWIQLNPLKQKFYIIDEYQNKSIDIYHYIDILDSKGYKSGIHYGDPQSGENRQLTSGQSPANILRNYGIIFRSQRTRINTRIVAARNIIDNFQVSSKCILAIEMFTSWQMKRPKTGNNTASMPEHSVHSHIGEAFTYFCFNYRRLNTKPLQTQNRKVNQSVSGVNF